MLSKRQLARQDRRDRGRYVRMNRCEVCGTFVGDDYYSDERCNRTGCGLVLCEGCCIKVGDISDEDYVQYFKSLEGVTK